MRWLLNQRIDGWGGINSEKLQGNQSAASPRRGDVKILVANADKAQAATRSVACQAFT